MAEAVGVDGKLLPGLRNVWYDYGGDNCAGIEKAQIKGEYVTDGVVIPREARENIGLVITGYIEVPHDGIYSFALYSDDGSQLIIDDKMVVDSDGMHDIMEVKMKCVVWLTAIGPVYLGDDTCGMVPSVV